MLEEPKPVIAAALFPEILAELIALLKTLSTNDWQKPTACANWSVKDVALHLLGGEIGNLSRRRDGNIPSASINDWNELVTFINEANQNWISAANFISTRLIIDLLELVGSQMSDYFQELDPFSMGCAVSWAGPDPAPVWLDIAREYTERWHHQQHIRDAVGKPGLKQPKYFSPVLETFMQALPRTYREIDLEDGTTVTVTVTGQSGGRWSIVRMAAAWQLYSGAPSEPTTEIIIDQETAWRLFTKGISQNQAQGQMTIRGDQGLGRKVFEMVSIIA
ncbi:MAG: maleylpyruvate isomerase N-terminal domain-containing protein [Anaerolineaceae bacterium]|nr:maleylpyruvate isomerase N-terminal domain-containing protein [Anaerolineaceae bacterium]